MGWGASGVFAQASTVSEARELSKKAAMAVARQQWEEARALYQKLVEVTPDHAPALVNLGTVEYQLKAFDEAFEHLDKAVRLDPNLTQAWLTLGLVHYERKEWWRSLSALSRAIADEPENPRAHNYLAATLKQLKWSAAAEAALQRALDLDPAYAEANFNLAVLYLERRPPSPELARRHYLRALEFGSSRDEALEKQLKELLNMEINSPETSEGAGRASGSGQSGAPASSEKKAAPSSRSQNKE